MKQLSIEEKAKRYDQALGKARRYYDEYKTRDNILYVEDMEEMFPELKESEDEKIKKGIVKYLEQSQFGEEHYCVDDDIVREYIAWIEKQGEKKSIDKKDWTKNDSRILYNVKAYIGYAAGQRGVKDELFKEANEWLNSLPIEFIYNKNYNEDMVTLLVGELEQIANDNNAPLQYQAEINWLKSLRPQSKQEWNEEDAFIINKILYICNYYKKSFEHTSFVRESIEKDVNKIDNWLKSLKDRIQPKPELSEEDEEKIVKLKSFIAQCKGFNKENRNKAFDLIDSLTPQNTWKPSEEPMEK